MSTQALRELGLVALATGLDSVRTGAPFVPFCALEDADGELAVTWCVDASVEAAAIRARHVAAISSALRYAVARHEEIADREGVKRAAIVVEVGDRELPTALRMAQPFRPYLSPRQRAEALGTPMMLGDTDNALRGAAIVPGPEPAFVVLCPSCGRKNRVSLARVRKAVPTCGACHKPLLE